VDPQTAFILTEELNRIRTLPPYDRLPEARLAELLALASVVFYRRGSLIVHPEIDSASPCLWIVRQGRVRASELDPSLAALRDESTIDVGGIFPVESALDGGATWRVFAAEEDCYLWKVEGEGIARWLAEPAIVRWIGVRLRDGQRQVRDAAADLARGRQRADQALGMPARSVAAADIVCVGADQSVADVAALMVERRIGSVVVGTPEQVEGIVTQTDLIARGLAPRLPPDTPVAAVMTPAPQTIDDTASVLEVGLQMAQQHYRHLLLKSSEGPVVGLVSERDIFRAQQQGISDVLRPVDEAASVGELVLLARRVREFGERVFRQGMEVSQFARLMSSMNDRISRRVLAVLGAGRDFGAPYCWLAFGSEAREEQGFVTDQDNGIVFVPPAGGDAERVRAGLVDHARGVNGALDACGFPLCKGNIMAGNPQLCLTLAEWQAKFSAWIRSTSPKALLNATIFFDLRAVHGEKGLAEALADHLHAQAAGNTIFLHHLAVNALEVAPPIGRISRFATDSGEHEGTIDLKTRGTRLFVDVARIYALAHGVRAANTTERLRIVGQRTKRALSVIEGDIAAFRLLQAIRLRRQLDSLTDGGDPNRVDPYALDEMRQRILRESLRQAQSLQERLKTDYCP
jgi:CBS domain-containing protein